MIVWESGNRPVANLVIHFAAEAEYEVELAWYLNRSQRAATRFMAAFEAACFAITTMPEASAICDPIHRRRQLKRYPYGIVYRVESEQILIVAMPHDRQLPGYWDGRVSS